MLYNILKDQWQTIEIDRIRSITQETEFSQMAELLCVIRLHQNLNTPTITIFSIYYTVPNLQTAAPAMTLFFYTCIRSYS